MGSQVRLRVAFMLIFVVGCAFMIVGEFAWRLDHGNLIVAGLVLIAASIVAQTALVAASSPTLLVPFSAIVAVVPLVGAIVLLLIGHPKYAGVFGFWTFCSVGAYLVCRVYIPRSATRAKRIAGCCPACGGRLEPKDDACPWCGVSFRSPSLPAKQSAADEHA